MEISQIKAHVSITQVLQHYGIAIIKNKQCRCPFHQDKTPSMQVYPDSNTVYCFSGNCNRSGKPIDVIDFIMYKEGISKHQAILKAKTFTNLQKDIPVETTKLSTAKNSSFLSDRYETFIKSTYQSSPAKAYLTKRNLLGLLKIRGLVGFNSGQFHHAGRFDHPGEKKQMIAQALKHGLLIDCGLTSKTGEKAYQVFGNKSLVFPLRDQKNEITSFYFRSVQDTNKGKHFYLKNRSGLYPNYPPVQTTRLLLTESIIDAATLLQTKLPQGFNLLASYGTNGLTGEHTKAIGQLKNLKEIIFCFDNDSAGEKASLKYGKQLQKTYPNLSLTQMTLPNKDVNEVAQLHELEIFKELIAKRSPLFSSPEKITAAEIPQQQNQLQYINDLIAKSGIIGEENSRLLLFIIASSYKTGQPLHAIVQGSSGSGKTHLISKIADLMPKEEVLRFTRITESALYNFSEDMLVGKLIVIEDLDGLKEETLLAFRELVSNHQVSSGVSVKDKKGNIKSTTKLVRGLFSSMSATTRGSIYEDNMNRSFLLAVDESARQSSKIIDYQNRWYAGLVSKEEQYKAKETLQQFIRNLQNLPVVNPFATRLQLPDSVHKKRRLNQMFQSIIRQVTFINQKQRPLKNGCIYTEVADIEMAIEILFDSIILKIDELEGSQRVFYQTLYQTFKNNQFTRFEAMQATGFKKTQLQYHLNKLVQLEYLQQFGFSNRGFKYKIGFEDSIDTVRKSLKDHFAGQLKKLKGTMPPNANEHQPNARRTPELHN